MSMIHLIEKKRSGRALSLVQNTNRINASPSASLYKFSHTRLAAAVRKECYLLNMKVPEYDLGTLILEGVRWEGGRAG